MPIEAIKSGLGNAVSTVSEKFKESMSFLVDLKDAGWEKVTTFVKDILGLAPLIEETGYSMKDVSVDATIPPSITALFAKIKEVDAETIDKLVEDNKDREIFVLIVKALQKADDLQKGIKMPGYQFSGLGMKLGIPPDISLKFARSSN